MPGQSNLRNCAAAIPVGQGAADHRGDMTAPASSTAAPSSPPSLGQLYLGFAQISLSAFGGALPWARRILVEDRGWLEPDDFTDTLALCQFLPGPNIINLSIVIGSRYRGPL